MLVELSMFPVNGHIHLSGEISEVLKIVDESKLPYRFTPTSTCIEGEWDDVMGLVRRCHARMRQTAPHVITFIKIEDDEGDPNKLEHNIKSVEEKVGHPLRK